MKPTAFARLALASAALLAACAAGAKRPFASSASGGPRPDWVEGEGRDFPRSRFVLGVGSADDESSAGDRARGELARVFSADVKVNSSVDQAESSLEKDGKATSSFSSSVAEQVRTATQKVLEGVDVVARWRDPQTGRHYALAALPKAQAILALTEKARDLDEDAARQRERLSRASDPFEKAKAGAKLVALAKAYAGLEADSRVLGGGSLDGEVDYAAAQAEARAALSALDVVVSVSGEGADAVETALVSALSASGLTAKRGGTGDLKIEARVSISAQDSGDKKWARFRSAAAVTLQDSRAGKDVAAFDVSAREDALVPAEARRRALASLAKKASAQAAATIGDFFANQ